MTTTPNITRRKMLGMLAASPLLLLTMGLTRPITPGTRPIPSSGETLPMVGLGSWISFNVGDDLTARNTSADVIRSFFQAGGTLIDSSPMYGSAQEVIGYCLNKIGLPKKLFAADKVWISDGDEDRTQIDKSRQLWGVPHFDLLQVHNLLSWESHLPALFAMKESGKLRYVGITTSHGRRHDEMEKIMKTQPLDFIQLTYNLYDREAEQRLLPLAQDRGIAVIVNRPFQQGALLRRLARHPLPAWAADLNCSSWAQFSLKFIISHPAVTCAIPATTSVPHVIENMEAAAGVLPDITQRTRMSAYVDSL